MAESFTVAATPNDAPVAALAEGRLENRLAGPAGLPAGTLLARYTLSDDHDAVGDLGVALDSAAPLALVRDGVDVVVAAGEALGAGDVDYTLTLTDLEAATGTVAESFTVGAFAGVANGSFEHAAPGATVNHTPWGRSAAALSGWTEADGQWIELNDGTGGPGHPTPPHGTYTIDMQEFLNPHETDVQTQVNLTLSQQIAIDPWMPLTVSLEVRGAISLAPTPDNVVVTWTDASGTTTETFLAHDHTWRTHHISISAPMDAAATSGTLTLDTTVDQPSHNAVGAFVDDVRMRQ